jgi:hypothetical protein
MVAKLVAIIDAFQFAEWDDAATPAMCLYPRYGMEKRAESAKTIIAVGIVTGTL